ncbi:MAG: MmgE/PrpD family protein [Hoeflea sp.]|uniref:MmgE/PrpD family protein n=1 Tax=Hoeflea sp. TaxID=1940281 RepID=UPI001E0B0095|nr:MmgE/PrpD family protein [Hoeflea sp.]MBU4530340.1 MmgE/PrpD family protein [Alphaproteobacteria bacterium]MBU4545127.1 MmgE/PrpD family protein [Alphaproteobacteria bacterium]MBU4549673.1 MmgE/PrpD family protein [Alphaproteobacteria bacterium]MBV1721930.1 MmgE/PrpD family protein [Hoeflea sp.]MBV1761280.1 MmgE/PrpD family protein [Hoeflea sp.]
MSSSAADRAIGSNNDLGLSQEVANFVVGAAISDLPAIVIENGKKSILDGLGLALSGSVAQSGEYVRTHLADIGHPEGAATVIGSALMMPPRFAAFANGVGIHADDYDDTQLAVARDRVYGLLTHPTAPALPAALALGEAHKSTGAEVMLAYHLGVEVECKIAEAINPRHYQTGFHATATCGTFAAASAAGRLMGLNNEQMARALSIAGSQSAGLRENFGTMTKPFHAGRSSESGVVAAQFASYGWTATDKILEAPRGFFSAAGGGYDATAIHGKFGAPWTFETPGVSIKPHPSGSLTHPGMTEMMRLIHEHDIKAEDVVSVRVGTNSNMPNALIHHRPTNELQAKFSMEFCMAILLIERRAGLPEFLDETVLRPDVKAMIEKVDFCIDDRAEAAGYHLMTTYIDIKLKDGSTISGMADFGKGSPANPMSYQEVSGKFLENAEFARWDMGKAGTVVDMVADFENLKSIEALMSLLRTA